VALFSDCAFFNNGVNLIAPMPDAGLCCRLMHVVETTIQIYFLPLLYEKVNTYGGEWLAVVGRVSP
jgi:hypothetical protein